jgi:16S rRNA (cytidine1402-2'-O)-methyltransferase
VGTLFVVATPIGNLEDVTPRALRVLGESDLVLAEDTRRTRVLLDRHGVSARPLSLHAHNEASRVERALSVLASGGTVALVSDAGTPLVSDPGERLVAAAIEAGNTVTPVPGASAVLAALSVSGLPAGAFSFLGFPPRPAGARDASFEAVRDRAETLVWFESPRRVATTLRRLASILGDRRACVARELTKLHEEAVRGTLSELAEHFAEGARREVTIVVAGAPAVSAHVRDLDAEIRRGLEAGESARQIADGLERPAGLSRRDVYQRALELGRGSAG